MSESVDNTYATTNSNIAAGAPNKVAVVNDGTADRQIVGLGALDGTGTIIDGTPANPLNQKITNGTNIADVVAGDSGFNGVTTTSAIKTYTFSTSTSGAQTILADTPTQGFSWVEVIYTSVGSGLAVTGQFSPNSGGTYIIYTGWGSGGGQAGSGLGALNNTIYSSVIHGRYFQLAVSALASGTFSGYVILHASAKTNENVLAAQSGSWTVGFTNSAVSTGTITTSSSAITSGNIVNTISGFVPITIHGTYSGVSFGITVSDDAGTTFYNVPIYDSNNSRWLAPGATITPGTNASSLYWIPFPVSNTGSEVKVTASAYSSGTANIRIEGTAGTGLPGSSMSQIMDSAGNARGANVTAGNAVQAAPGPTATSAITSVASANTNTSLLASNTSRSGAYFFNDSTAILYLAFASSASTTAYTVQIGAGSFFEMPTNPVYTGAIFGIWASANGNARITELS